MLSECRASFGKKAVLNNGDQKALGDSATFNRVTVPPVPRVPNAPRTATQENELPATGSGEVFGPVSLGVTALNSVNVFWTEFARRKTRLTVTANDGVQIRLTHGDLRNIVLSIGNAKAEGPWSAPAVFFLRSGKERKPLLAIGSAQG